MFASLMVLILSSLASSEAVSGGLLAVSVSESAGAAAVGPLSLHSQASSSSSGPSALW